MVYRSFRRQPSVHREVFLIVHCQQGPSENFWGSSYHYSGLTDGLLSILQKNGVKARINRVASEWFKKNDKDKVGVTPFLLAFFPACFWPGAFCRNCTCYGPALLCQQNEPAVNNQMLCFVEVRAGTSDFAWPAGFFNPKIIFFAKLVFFVKA